jgi:hypothetical protein
MRAQINGKCNDVGSADENKKNIYHRRAFI